ncbi:MAG: hypothetical protein ACRDQ2_12355, partial [Gaiellales bacterium]
MAVKFLSEDWAQEVTNALNSSDEFQNAASNQAVKLQQVITDAPDGEVKYFFTLEGGKVQVGLGEISDAEATLTQNYETAFAFTMQVLYAQYSFLQGMLKIYG